LKRISKRSDQYPVFAYESEVKLLIGAYNEIDFVHKKVENSRQLVYPSEKLKMIWVTDGSNDGISEAVGSYDVFLQTFSC